MRKLRLLTVALFLLLSCGSGVFAITLTDIAERIRKAECYQAHVNYEVLLPNFSDPVNYSIILRSSTASDTLAPCNYIINWVLTTPVSTSEGFNAFFDGSHFRFRDKRMQEYHIEEGPEIFAPAGNNKRGVQYQAQFAELLPSFIAERFEDMAQDSTYEYTITESSVITIEGVRRVMGYDSVEFEYTLDGATFMPISIELDNNPGQISEQTVTVTYSDTTFPEGCIINLEVLSNENSEVFEKYRNNFYSLEMLPGNPLPGFTARTINGDRYIHERGEASGKPFILAFVDTEVVSTPDVIKAVRDAVDFLPLSMDIVWGFLNRRADDIMLAVGDPRPAETVLMNVTSAARECGVGALTPVLIYVDANGNVSDFTKGFNQDLQSIVIQKAGLNGKL